LEITENWQNGEDKIVMMEALCVDGDVKGQHTQLKNEFDVENNNERTSHRFSAQEVNRTTDGNSKLLQDLKSDDWGQPSSSRSTSISFDSSGGSTSPLSHHLSSKCGCKSDILAPRSSILSGVTKYRQNLTNDFRNKLRRLEQQEILYGRQSQVEELMDIFQNEITSSATNNVNFKPKTTTTTTAIDSNIGCSWCR
jgi:hypothetical protein